MAESLISFPVEVRMHIGSISSNGGMLTADLCQKICSELSIDLDTLMTLLLPLAASYSNPSISSYQVGAIARGETKQNGFANLYLGANFEFSGQALCFSIHAEQAALSNGWCHGESYLEAIAVTAPPCGHCRQFLYEMVGDKSFPVVLPSATGDDKVNPVDLSDLLPSAFGPLDLGCDRLLMDASFGSNQLNLIDRNDDDLINKALQAADLSYAPYTANFAGCAIKLSDGKIYTGRYAENAAHNPSLSPFASAFSNMMVSRELSKTVEIERVVLVESPTLASQKNVCQNQLLACRSCVNLEYITASSGCQ